MRELTIPSAVIGWSPYKFFSQNSGSEGGRCYQLPRVCQGGFGYKIVLFTFWVYFVPITWRTQRTSHIEEDFVSRGWHIQLSKVFAAGVAEYSPEQQKSLEATYIPVLSTMPETDGSKPVTATSKPDSLMPERQTNPTAPDLEACQPLLSRTSTLQGSNSGRDTPVFTSDKGQARRRAWSNWSFRLDARIVSDAILGLSDGLTVPFALTAGLTALGDTKFVILGGLAELIAGAISMGLGGYVGAKSEV